MVALTRTQSDAQLLSRAVGDITRRTSFPVSFAGMHRNGTVDVLSIAGARTRSLDGLVVRSMRGLGGKALVEKRPRLTGDYGAAQSITHDYDRAVLGEGIGTLLAVPVMVGGECRAVLYAGSRTVGGVGDAVLGPAFRVAEEFATELRIRDEVERRLEEISPAVSDPPALAPFAQEELRESYVELRRIAATVSDAGLRARLATVEDRLAALSADGRAPILSLDDVHLSPREVDVLACAALGSTNSEIAASLSLKEGTVKSYLSSAMSKLDASTRHSAVTKARRVGILP
ncbi:LuxR C-terminal-related transcriptional regulator [Microbacterium sp. P03]|uniref:LuxR C-terminal-related transcriptional regulator n=1 Tax=Microbacterium sp. P03 TaxID=3366946 RepID=UPI00374569D0